ncbi:MAG: hypothetical protein KKA31_06150, partial [Candidatus Margulisbacteria bacterium]|nr:hypothetical protein [Candidatus Margulisiibacteriota bacterium]
IVLLFWLFIIIVSRYFVPSTIFILAGVPVMMLVLGKGAEEVFFGVSAFALALYTHREDIKRFIAGKELKTAESVKHYMGK